ncbi:MAG: 50S ribosomal protein L3 N(5)-glutamine methyltransferase [Wenzhouxiangellaceae bacterium]
MSSEPRISATTPSAATRGDWVRKAAEAMQRAGLYFGHGTATALDEAAWMLSHACGLAPDFDSAEFDRPLALSEREALDALLRRRIESRQPLAYLIGEAWFAGLKFEVDASTLVPRSPLAEIVTGGLMPWQDFSRPLRVLDVGTGSGCIAIALAVHWPELLVTGADVSLDALGVAKRNVQRHSVADRVRLIESDVFTALGDQRFDLMISNPPYVPAASMRDLPDEYRHEPELALVAGDDGLRIFRRLLAGAPEHLTPGGLLLVELGEAAPAAAALLADTEAVWLEFEHGGEGVVLLDRAACSDVAGR